MDSGFLNDAGITVPGSESQQAFYHASDFPVEQHSIMIVLRLRGAVGNVLVAAPVTVGSKLTCSTCGKVSKSSMQFCGRCGTALVLV
jgi:hypothetical protein